MARKPKLPPPPPLFGTLWALVKYHRGKTFTILTVLGAIPLAWGGASFIYDKAEPSFYTSHAAARLMQADYEAKIKAISDASDQRIKDIGEQNKKLLEDLKTQVQTTGWNQELSAANGKREATDNELARWNTDLLKATDQHMKDTIADQIKKLQDTRNKLTAQIMTLCGNLKMQECR